MITIAAIMGLGMDPADELLGGFRDCLEDQVQKDPTRIGYLVFSHADKDLHAKVLALPGEIITASHSNGADENSENIDPMYYWNNREIYAEMMMDAKPEWHDPGDIVDWLNPWYQYPLPKATTRYHAFYGRFGCPYFRLTNSTKLDIDHADFPAASECHQWLSDRVDEWLAENPV